MANSVITAEARITARDETGSAFASVEKKLQGLGRASKASVEVDRLSKSLGIAEQKMRAIDKAQRSQDAFERSRASMKRAGDALAVYNKAMADTARASPGMAVAQARAQVTFDRAMGSYKRQREILAQNASALGRVGVSAGNLASQETALRREINLTSDALARQARVARQNAKSRAEAAHHIERHGAVRTALGAAAGAVSIHSIAEGVGHTIRSGARYQHEETSLVNAGRTPEEMHEIEEASRRTARLLPTATFTENLKVINETTGAFGSLHHAIENLPFMQKTASVLHAAAGDKIHEGAGELGNKLARFFEERQVAGDTPTFQREAEGLVRAMAFSRGNFNPSEALNFAQQAKSALPNYSERFLTRIAPSLVTMLGGDRAGTAANAFNSVLTGKVNDKKQAEEWMRYGLLDPKQAVMKAGHAVGWRAGAVKETNLALSDPLKWMEEVALPAMKSKGVKVDDRLELTKALATMFRNANANVFANDIAQPASRSRLHKDEEMIGKAGTLDEIYTRNLQTDPTVAVTALTASLENLTTAASSPAMKIAAETITSLSGAVQSLALAAKDHPLLAMTGGATAAVGAAAGAGWMSYQFMNGFGLSKSALALDGAAEALSAAAIKLGGGSAAATTGAAVAGTEAGGSLLSRVLGGAVGRTGGVLAPVMLLRELGEAHRPMTPEGAGYRLDQKIDFGTWERAQRGVMEQRLDPEGRRGREMMRAFGSSVPDGPGGTVRAELTGTAEVRGETTVEVKATASSELIAIVDSAKRATVQMSGQVSQGGGTTMPQYASPPIKAGPR